MGIIITQDVDCGFRLSIDCSCRSGTTRSPDHTALTGFKGHVVGHIDSQRIRDKDISADCSDSRSALTAWRFIAERGSKDFLSVQLALLRQDQKFAGQIGRARIVVDANAVG